jgi:formylglycine-generating enzyme required for sulfatase activity
MSPAAPPVESTDLLCDLAHEALLQDDASGKPYWPRLREWADRDRRRLEDQAVLEGRAARWRDAGRPFSGSLLAAGRELRDFRRAGARDESVRAYLRASTLMQRFVRAGIGLLAAATALIVYLNWLDGRGLDLHYESHRVLADWGIVLAPSMVSISPGSFRMGCLEGDDCSKDEIPVRPVKVPGFEMSRFEVTFAEYDRFAHEKGATLPDAPGGQRGGRPVVEVSWQDAVDYTEWLSTKNTKTKQCRLPTEAEWEYAARAGTPTRYWWGEEVTPGGRPMANCADCGSAWDGRESAPVGSFPANAWGLHDMHGNVWEWVEDCYRDSYEGAPEDGSARRAADGGECTSRVLRGGSWRGSATGARAAYRDRAPPDLRRGSIGFRVVCSSPIPASGD